jgi:hypothetical protein
MMPYFSVKEEIESNQLKGEIVDLDRPAISTFLAYHKDKWLSPSMTMPFRVLKFKNR